MNHPLRATYRLQLGPGLGFAQVQGLLPYLDALGISHLSLSPAWRARQRPAPGQDVVDPATVSGALGGEAGLRSLADAAHARAMGLILDVVPDPAGVPPEGPAAFAAAHATVIELVRAGVADGIRFNHPDGTSPPAGYLRELRRAGVEHVWVDKIPAKHEALRDQPTEGTTGYEFCVDVQALFVDPAGEAPLTALWTELSGDARPFAERADVEDAAFHRYLRLLALNEVGGDPGRFNLPVVRFHAANAERARRFPRALLATSTHDTQRSGDARARLGALAGLGEEWAGAVRRWHTDNAPLRDAGLGVPTPTEELLVYQTLISAWPVGMDRLEPSLLTALREAAQGTSWAAPDEAHEQAVIGFARRLVDHGPFRYGFDGWAARVADAGAREALGQTLLKLTVPGVPVIYQGDETWFLALVDPDNRRPVDWGGHAATLSALQDGMSPTREAAKLHLVLHALQLRRSLPHVFMAPYTPIEAGDGVCAFLRGDDVLVAVALRDRVTGSDGWAPPASMSGVWQDVLTGAEHDLPAHASLTAVLGPDGRALLRRMS